MKTSRRRGVRQLGVVLAAGTLVLATVGAQVAVGEVSGNFAGGADADLVEVSAVALPPGCGNEPLLGLVDAVDCDFELAELEVGDSEASASGTGGLQAETVDASNLSSFGHASNVDVEALTAGGVDGAIAEDLLVQSNAFKPGGPSRDADELLDISNELLELAVARTQARAMEVGPGNTTCPNFVDGRATMAQGRNDTVGLKLVPDAVGGALLAVEDGNGVSYAESRTELVDDLVGARGDGRYGIESSATVELLPFSLLGDAVTVNVLHPGLIGRHDGQRFTFDYETPVVTINGDTVVDGQTIEVLEGLDLEAGVLTVTTDIANADEITVEGNRAVVSDVVELTLALGDPDSAAAVEIATVSVGDLSVMAQTPAGGVTITGCAVRGEVADRLPDEAADRGLPRTGGGALAIAGLGMLLAAAGGLRRRG